MGIVNKLRSVFGGGAGGAPDESGADAAESSEPPTHRCQSCGEEYRANPDVTIDSCRSCGGTKVTAVS